MGAVVSTPRRRGRSGRGRRGRSAAEASPPLEPEEGAWPGEEVEAEPEGEPSVPATPLAETSLPEVATGIPPETVFAARIPPPLPVRPPPATRRAIFFDVENTSRAEHIARVLDHLQIDWIVRATELVAVGNWRVIGHDTARLLAQQGAHLVHSAPAVGVRDWSDLRIAVAAGVWLAGARPGDTIEIITDDQAFDAVGDVASSLGVAFRRLSYRALAGMPRVVPAAEAASEGRGRRRRRGGRRARYGASPGPSREAPVRTVSVEPANGLEPDTEAHTAPHDEIVAVVRDLLAQSPDRGISLDSLSNALKARGFRRTPGSPRLITRLRRIKEVEVTRSGTIRLVNGTAPADERDAVTFVEAEAEGESREGISGEPGAPAPAPRRRRRRGGRRRRGRGGGQAQAASS
jgi:hypothetical protein